MCVCVPLTCCRGLELVRPTVGVSTIKPGAGGGRPGGVMCVCVPLTRCRRAREKMSEIVDGI